MKFEENRFAEKLGFGVGYLFSFLLFTLIFSAILTFSRVLKSYWSYLYILLGVIGVVILAKILNRLLK